MKLWSEDKAQNFVPFPLDHLLAWLTFLLLTFIGILNQFNMGEDASHVYKNILWYVIGLSIFFLIYFKIDFKKIPPQIYLISYMGITLLLALLAIFKKRWLIIGSISIQPSEFLKIILLLFFSYLFSKRREGSEMIALWLVYLGLLGLPLLFLLPVDLDYAFIIGLTFFLFFVFSGLPKRLLFLFIGLGLILSVTLVPLAWHKLKPHQKGRIYGFLEPQKYYKTWSYQLYQSMIAIGSGGMTGQGFKQGWSTRLNYLPAKHTDLAFSVWAEAFGFLGVSIYLTLYGYLLYWALNLTPKIKDPFGKYLCLGIFFIFLFQLFFNLGGSTGLLFMTSIPQPFLSYGGSITITTYILLAFLFKLAKRKFIFK